MNPRIVKQPAPRRVIRVKGVCADGKMSRATIYRRVRDDPDFPKPFKLSPGITAFDEDEFASWLAKKKAASRAAQS